MSEPESKIVVGYINPIKAEDLNLPMDIQLGGDSTATAEGKALQESPAPEPQTVSMAGEDIGRVIAAAEGIVCPTIISVDPPRVAEVTMIRARELALTIRSHIEQMPLTELSADLITICMSLLHCQDVIINIAGHPVLSAEEFGSDELLALRDHVRASLS